MIENRDVMLYQVMDCLVANYGYHIIRFQGQKKDLWLTNKDNPHFPIIRLTSKVSSSIVFEKDYLNRVKSFLGQFMFAKEMQSEIIIINSNPESVNFQEENFSQITISYEPLPVRLDEAFPKLKEYVHPVENNDEAVAQINRNIEAFQMKKAKEAKRKSIPKFTLGIMAICILIYALQFILGQVLSNVPGNDWNSTLILCGAYYTNFISGAHEYWRFLTYGFLHADIIHLFVNMMSLYYLGNYLQRVYTRKQFLVILLASIIGGGLLTYIVSPTPLMVGISGGLYGLLGAYLLSIIENDMIRIPQIRNSVIQVVLINILISLMPGISLTGHLGGFIVGVGIAFLFSHARRYKPYKIHVAISMSIIVLVAAYFAIQPRNNVNVYYNTNQQVIKDLEYINLDGYANYLENQLIHYLPEE
ncbi:membrane associated rhomboid family serine protease [Breznakia blatticola]|uniref:Membrane associated rhomboid family serine protease n=1 Tax=Breznakia blatticola TaxID=1754012 RepID=A0A4R8A781_9FIRM|nr:rhomboid family intramembrane serine protease [Breznakia blatticola]TDW26338.1 membrane associated rhomboid family serine protease [Breznakia blatticola]